MTTLLANQRKQVIKMISNKNALSKTRSLTLEIAGKFLVNRHFVYSNS